MNKDPTKMNKESLTAYQQFLLQSILIDITLSRYKKHKFVQSVYSIHASVSLLSFIISAHQFHQIKFKQLAFPDCFLRGSVQTPVSIVHIIRLQFKHHRVSSLN